jgi:hypothetical protein
MLKRFTFGRRMIFDSRMPAGAAGEKAMADYKRFGIEPVVAPFLQNNGKKAK